MANFVWKRFEDKPHINDINELIFFEDLEKVAYESLRSGQIVVQESLMMSCTTNKNHLKVMKECGFLLRAWEDCEYQFWHTTFQEFFAGRYIARCLLKEASYEKRRVRRFIQRTKYIEKYTLTICFPMHAFAKACGEDALEDMLSILDEQPVEILGIRHLFLRMRVLEACLEEADKNDLPVLLRDEEALELIESVRELSMRTIDDAPLRQIVVENSEQCSIVLERFPDALSDTVVEEVKQLLARGRGVKNEEKVKVKDALKLAKCTPKNINEIYEFSLKLPNVDIGRCCAMGEDTNRRATHIARKASDQLHHLLSMLEGEWSNEGSKVHQNLEATGRALALQPHELYDISVIMGRRCTDKDVYVRQKAMETIGRIIEATPRIASDLLPMLETGCSDEDSDVCETARRTLNGIKPEKIVPPTVASRSAYKGGLLLLFALKAFTIEPLRKKETATFIVHTTFPQ